MAQKGRKAQREQAAAARRYASQQLATVMAAASRYLEDDSIEDIYLDVEHIDHACGHADHELKVVIKFAGDGHMADLWDHGKLCEYLSARLEVPIETLTPRDGWYQTDTWHPEVHSAIRYEGLDTLAADIVAAGLTWAELIGRPAAVPANA